MLDSFTQCDGASVVCKELWGCKEGLQSLHIYVGDAARAKGAAGPSAGSVAQHTLVDCTVHTAVSRQTTSTSRQRAVRRSRLLSQSSEGHRIVGGSCWEKLLGVET